MLKSNIDVFLCDVISLFALVFIDSFDRAYKEVSTKNIENLLWLSFCDMTVPSKSNVSSVTLTFDLRRSIFSPLFPTFQVNNINLFIYIMTRALQDLAFSEYLFSLN